MRDLDSAFPSRPTKRYRKQVTTMRNTVFVPPLPRFYWWNADVILDSLGAYTAPVPYQTSEEQPLAHPPDTASISASDSL